MISANRAFGNKAENAACKYLRANGFELLERNWRRPWGELDIVARRHGILHFVEVKAQTASMRGFQAHIRAGHTKLEKVVRTARSWLAARHCSPEPPWQIDIIEVTIPRGASRASLRHFQNILP